MPMLNIYVHELKQYRISTAIWVAVLVLMSVVYISIWPTFESAAEATREIIENFPPAFKEIIGFSNMAFTSLESFFSLIFMFILVAGGVQAMHLGTAIVSKESRDQTSDFLIAKPVSRTTILSSKLLAAITLLILTNAIYISSTFLIMSLFSEQEIVSQTMFMIMLTMFFLQLFFLALGFLVATVRPKIKSVIAVSLPVVFAFYFISILDNVIGDTAVSYITPFKYFDFEYIIEHNFYELSYLITGAVFIVVALVTSYIFYVKKDV
ncbi:MAG: ABC transporter permease subunit [bacterium]|nr:ABC transporter permease subunit [bacterium]